MPFYEMNMQILNEIKQTYFNFSKITTPIKKNKHINLYPTEIFLNGLVHLPFVELSIIIFLDKKVRIYL